MSCSWHAARPELRERDFFVTGESYAGHYIPVVTHHIWRTNKGKAEGDRINLAGMAIGNGMCAQIHPPGMTCPDLDAETGTHPDPNPDRG